MAMLQAKVVFTTNFDDVIETAYSEVSSKNLTAFHLEGSYAALDALNAERFPLYAKIHGDFRYTSIKNLAGDLLSNDRKIQECFLAAATRSGLVVTGYSGRDANVMSMFKAAIKQNNAFPQGLFWTIPRVCDLGENVLDLVTAANERGVHAHIVESGTFDEMLSKIWRQFKERPRDLDEKVRTAQIAKVSIPLPETGKHFPILRTNALPLLTYPARCGMVELEGAFTFGDLKRKIVEESPRAVLTYTDRILFWGNENEIAKVLPEGSPRTIEPFAIKDGHKLVSESGFVKSFFEEALVTALCEGKSLHLRRHKNKKYYAVVQHGTANEKKFDRLRNVLGYKGKPGFLTGSVPGLKDVTWAESVSIVLEERGGRLWVMLRPDIWIKPLSRRQEAIDFLRKRRLYRYNRQSYQLLDAWIEILLGEVGSGRTAKVSCYEDTEYRADFEIGTRTAYSFGGDHGS